MDRSRTVRGAGSGNWSPNVHSSILLFENHSNDNHNNNNNNSSKRNSNANMDMIMPIVPQLHVDLQKVRDAGI